MLTPKRTAAVLALAAAALAAPAPATESAATADARFRPGSGSFLTTTGTDGLRQVGGTLRFTQSGTGQPITVNGSLTGLAPRNLYVAVPYKDGVCLPTPGVTAFPSGTFYTDTAGRARVSNVKVDPAAVNPAGTFNVNETRSVSVRQAIVTSVALPGIPVGTPTVPNGAQPEACDRNPVVGS